LVISVPRPVNGLTLGDEMIEINTIEDAQTYILDMCNSNTSIFNIVENIIQDLNVLPWRTGFNNNIINKCCLNIGLPNLDCIMRVYYTIPMKNSYPISQFDIYIRNSIEIINEQKKFSIAEKNYYNGLRNIRKNKEVV
jgi:hypothetical protein